MLRCVRLAYLLHLHVKSLQSAPIVAAPVTSQTVKGHRILEATVCRASCLCCVSHPQGRARATVESCLPCWSRMLDGVMW
jgi:hypothetical protein